jgi:hypothetical protein
MARAVRCNSRTGRDDGRPRGGVSACVGAAHGEGIGERLAPHGGDPVRHRLAEPACDIAGSAFSPLTQIKPSNVGNLKGLAGVVQRPELDGEHRESAARRQRRHQESSARHGHDVPGHADRGRSARSTTGNTLWTFQGAASDLDTGATYPRIGFGSRTATG